MCSVLCILHIRGEYVFESMLDYSWCRWDTENISKGGQLGETGVTTLPVTSPSFNLGILTCLAGVCSASSDYSLLQPALFNLPTSIKLVNGVLEMVGVDSVHPPHTCISFPLVWRPSWVVAAFGPTLSPHLSPWGLDWKWSQLWRYLIRSVCIKGVKRISVNVEGFLFLQISVTKQTIIYWRICCLLTQFGGISSLQFTDNLLTPLGLEFPPLCLVVVTVISACYLTIHWTASISLQLAISYI